MLSARAFVGWYNGLPENQAVSVCVGVLLGLFLPTPAPGSRLQPEISLAIFL